VLVQALPCVKLTQPELATVLSSVLPRSQTSRCGSTTSLLCRYCLDFGPRNAVHQ